MASINDIRSLQGFWTRQFAFYLNEHQHPLNRLTHMFGIPILIVTMVVALVMLDWRIFVGGQIVGWLFQLVGHRIEGNKPAFLKNMMATLMGPLMVGVEMVELLGVRFAFAERARRVVLG